MRNEGVMKHHSVILTHINNVYIIHALEILVNMVRCIIVDFYNLYMVR
jgi:hypothetical protein